MREFVRDLVIFQLVAVALALLAHPDASFVANLPGYLIITNGIAWSIRTIFQFASVRFGFLRWKRRWQLLLGLPMVVAGCLIGLFLASILYELFFEKKILGGPLFLAILRGSLPVAIIVTILILGYHSFRDRLESQAVEKERLQRLQARAELAALQSKLNPHFLFNTLNTMANLVHKEPEKVEEMILGLSDIYRKVLRLPSAERIALAEEFDLARRYLAIEHVRLGDRLRYDIILPERLRESPVPPLLIQPIVENAVLHGIMPVPGGGRVRLSALEGEGALRVVVEDDGVGIDRRMSGGGCADTAAARQGEKEDRLGMHVTRERLRLACGGRGAMHVESPAAGGCRVTLELPDEH